MSRYDPTAVAIEGLRAFGITPTEVRHSGSGNYKIYFSLSTRENNSLLFRPRRATAQLKTTTARWCAESFHQATEVL